MLKSIQICYIKNQENTNKTDKIGKTHIKKRSKVFKFPILKKNRENTYKIKQGKH